MLLEFDGSDGIEAIVLGHGFVSGASHARRVILGEHAIPEDGEIGGCQQFFFVEFGCDEHDVVDLPLAGLACDVDEGGSLAVDGGGLSVGLVDVVVGLGDLQFIFAEEEDPAVSPPEAILGVAHGGRCPLDMELATAELLFGLDFTCLEDVDTAVFESSGDIPLLAFPLREVLAVEEDDCIGRGLAALCARLDDGRVRSVAVMNAPGRVGQKRCVGEAQVVLLGPETESGGE